MDRATATGAVPSVACSWEARNAHTPVPVREPRLPAAAAQDHAAAPASDAGAHGADQHGPAPAAPADRPAAAETQPAYACDAAAGAGPERRWSRPRGHRDRHARRRRGLHPRAARSRRLRRDDHGPIVVLQQREPVSAQFRGLRRRRPVARGDDGCPGCAQRPRRPRPAALPSGDAGPRRRRAGPQLLFRSRPRADELRSHSCDPDAPARSRPDRVWGRGRRSDPRRRRCGRAGHQPRHARQQWPPAGARARCGTRRCGDSGQPSLLALRRDDAAQRARPGLQRLQSRHSHGHHCGPQQHDPWD